MDILHELWYTIKSNFVEVLAALGLGGGGGFLTKRALDKAQASKIEANAKGISNHETILKQVKSDIVELKRSHNEMRENQNSMALAIQKVQDSVETNTKFDKQLREDLKKEHDDLKDKFKSIDDNNIWIRNTLMEMNKK